MKPDWKDAPEWANWLAMDSDGGWWWHEKKPESNSFVFYSRARYELAETYWQDTLEQRQEP